MNISTSASSAIFAATVLMVFTTVPAPEKKAPTDSSVSTPLNFCNFPSECERALYTHQTGAVTVKALFRLYIKVPSNRLARTNSKNISATLSDV